MIDIDFTTPFRSLSVRYRQYHRWRQRLGVLPLIMNTSSVAQRDDCFSRQKTMQLYSINLSWIFYFVKDETKYISRRGEQEVTGLFYSAEDWYYGPQGKMNDHDHIATI